MKHPVQASLHKLTTIKEAKVCAKLMAESEPWITLKRDYNKSLAIFLDKSNETFTIKSGGKFAGFVIVQITGVFTPYIKSICVTPELRRKGIGTEVFKELEEKYSPDHDNIFLCVSSFNPNAAKLYTRLSYNVIGELRDFIVPGHSELLLRKQLHRIPKAEPPTDVPYITTDKASMDAAMIHKFLTKTYWAEGVTKENVIGRIQNALCFGVFLKDKQIGFARVITDYMSFAYLADVFILDKYRGKGYSKLLLKYIFGYPDLVDMKWVLGTKDAHSLYKKFGFKPVEAKRYMIKRP